MWGAASNTTNSPKTTKKNREVLGYHMWGEQKEIKQQSPTKVHKKN